MGLFGSLFDCGESKKSITPQIDKDVFTLYNKTDSLVQVARSLVTVNDSIILLLYEINISEPEDARQKFISSEQLTPQQLDSKKNELAKTYKWSAFNGDNVLFVQIQPTAGTDEMDLLRKRQKIEDKINVALERKNLGEWMAGDLGPGGGNILYTVETIQSAMPTVLQVLQENNLDKNVLIGRRVMVGEGDWFYEVIYPTNFSGEFNTM